MTARERKTKVTAFTGKGRLFRKYFLIISSVFIVCIILTGGLTLLFISQYWTQANRGSLLNDSMSVASMVERFADSGLLFNKADITSGERLREFIAVSLKTTSDSSGSDVFILRPDGTVDLCKEMVSEDVTGYPGEFECEIHSDIVFPPSFTETLWRGDTFTLYGDLPGVYSEKVFLAAAPIMARGQYWGAVVSVQSVRSVLTTFILDFLKLILIAMGIALVISFVTVYFLVYSITKPLSEMSDAARQYSNGNFSARVKVRGDDEMSSLCRSFNKMADSLEAMEASRSSFVSNVSHELRTPMTNISGFVQSILDGTCPESQRREKLNIIKSEVERMSRLVTSMLNLSRIEAGALKLEPRRFNLTELIFTTALGFEKSISEKNIDMVGLDKLPPIEVCADADMINQVLFNLIENAVKYTPEGNSIEIRAEKRAGTVYVDVVNHGIGIPEDECRMIFERFYKVDKSRSVNARSVGLGLYIVKTLIGLHNGTINVTSDGKTYTCFTFTLPPADKTAASNN